MRLLFRLMSLSLSDTTPKGRTIQSQVNCDTPDFEKFPLFRNAQCELAEIGPGDTLFIPAFYWHQVTSNETCVSVNVFFGDAGENAYMTKLIDTRWDALLYEMRTSSH